MLTTKKIHLPSLFKNQQSISIPFLSTAQSNITQRHSFSQDTPSVRDALEMETTLDFSDNPSKKPPPEILDPAKLWQIISSNSKSAVPLLLQTYRSLFEKGLLPSQNPKRKRKMKESNEDQLILAGKGSFDYLYHQEWPPFRTSKEKLKDFICVQGREIPKEGTKAFWEFMQRRKMADIFSEWGFGVAAYQHSLCNQTYTIDRNRLKGVLTDVIKEVVNLLQENINKKDTITFTPRALVSLSSRLLRPQNWLPVWAVAVLRNLIKMRYWLGGDSVDICEGVEFMAKCKDVASASKQYSLQYRVQELSQYEVPVKGRIEQDRVIVQTYLENFDYQQVGSKTGVGEQEAKQRIQEILRGVLRKVTCLMELIGVPRSERVRNRRQLQLVAGNSRCRQMQAVLLQFFLEPWKMDSVGIYNFYKLLREARNLFHLDKLQRGRQSRTPLLQRIQIKKKDQKNDGQLRRLYDRYLSLPTKQEIAELSINSRSSSVSLGRESISEDPHP